MKKVLAAVLCLAMLFCCAFAEGATGADVKGTGVELTIYTNSGDNGRGDWLIERAAQDGYKLTIYAEGAGAVQSRLKEEKNNPIADVVFGLNAIIWNDLIANDILLPYDAPTWASEVSEGLSDPNGYYYAIVKQAILLVYDSAQMPAEEAPKSWIDLATNPAYAGKYRCEIKLTGGTTRNVLAGILTQYLDPDGELGISEEGWAVVESFFQNGNPADASAANVYAEMIDPNSNTIMGQMWSSGVTQFDAQYGITSGVVVPEEGIPYAVEGVGLVKGTKNQEEALRFIEWFGSAQIQGEWCAKFGTMPANTIAAEGADPQQKALCSIPAQNIDWSVVAANIDAWCEKITLEYMQ